MGDLIDIDLIKGNLSRGNMISKDLTDGLTILVTNDDGIEAAGIRALVNGVANLNGNINIIVIAPNKERSGNSHAITVKNEITVQQVDFVGATTAYSIDGTPADCARLGILELCNSKPDMVLSGVNIGANVGGDVQYSGTAHAALEAAMFGIPAIAFSQRYTDQTDKQKWTTCEKIIPKIIENALENQLPFGTIYNVNIPNLPVEDVMGVRYAGLSSAVMVDKYKKIESNGEISFELVYGCHKLGGKPGDDYTLLSEGYVTITPLHFDLTNKQSIDKTIFMADEIESSLHQQNRKFNEEYSSSFSAKF